MSSQRRSWLKTIAASAALAYLGMGALAARAEDTIKIGVPHSLSGTMAISETIIKYMYMMQVDEINKHGGLLGKKVEAIVVDPASN